MKKVFYILLVISLTVTSACKFTAVGHKKTMFANSNGWFPKDFDPKIHTLYIPREDKQSWQRKLEDALKEYPYKYEFYDGSRGAPEIEFALQSKSWFATYGSGASKETSHYWDYYFIDFKKGKDYPPTGYYCGTPFSVLREIIKFIKQKYK